jgi:release factor glutamine methyltransferase
MTTLVAVAAEVAERLARAGVASPEVDARWLVRAASGRDPRSAPEAGLEPGAAARLEEMVARRAAREPLQLIVGSTAFRTLELACSPGVFIPRPETEILAGLAIDAARAAISARGAALVIEPCCGTGAVALSVAVEVVGAQVQAADISAAALRCARANLEALHAGGAGAVSAASAPVGERVQLHEGALLEAFDDGLRGRIDVLVANPPYLPTSDLELLPLEVSQHDPHAALFGGTHGHELVDELIRAATIWLAPAGTLLLELDVRRGEDAVTVARRAGLHDVRLEADLAGAPRFLVAHRQARHAQPPR